MPNIPPRALSAYPAPAGPWKPALDVFAVLAADPGLQVGPWTRAKYVYAWCGTVETGAWQLLWASVITPPTSPAAVYQATGTQVTVSWTLPSPNTAASWNVYRPDGSLAGTASGATATSFVDAAPLPGTGSYQVEAVNGADKSAKVATNSLSITLQPATATATVSGTTATVSWTAGAQGDPDTWAVWNVTDGAWSSAQLPGTTHSFAVTGLTQGRQYVFSVYPYLSGTAVANQGTPRSTATVNIAADTPNSVTLVASDQPSAGEASTDQFTLTWTAASGDVSSPAYEVETSTNGSTWTASTDDISPVVFTASPNGYARVRTLAPGGASAWVTVGPVAPYADVPANVPTSVTLVASDPPGAGEASSDQFTFTWVAATGASTGYEVESSTNGSTWTASTDDATPVLFTSSVSLYARVRTLSAGGPSAWVQKGPVAPYADAPANVPASVTLTAPASPLETLRLTWAAPAGLVTGYEVQTSPNNSTWTASADDVSPSDYSTSVAGYMRVRSLSAGGASAWVTKGPVTPNVDTTPPGAPVITSFKPESSYGRMVVRFTTSSVADFNSYRVDYSTDGGAYTNGSWVAANPSTAIAAVLGKTYVATDVAGVRVFFRDDSLNASASDSATYTLVASPKIIDPTDSATWRVDEWRVDSVAGSTGVLHGRTSSGENYGTWFYGEAIQDFVSTHTVVSGTVDYCRDGASQGSGSAIQPGVWTHTSATQPAGAPAFSNGPVLGSGVARSGTTGGSATLSAAQLTALAGTAKGLGIYRSTSDTNPDSAGSYYMRLFPFGTNSGGKISGRVSLNHLG